MGFFLSFLARDQRAWTLTSSHQLGEMTCKVHFKNALLFTDNSSTCSPEVSIEFCV